MVATRLAALAADQDRLLKVIRREKVELVRMNTTSPLCLPSFIQLSESRSD